MRYDDNGAPTGKLDHSAEVLPTVPAVFQKPLILALLGSYLKQLQDLEDACWQLFTLRFLSVAENEALEKWGRLVGESRNGDSDDFYRVRITIRIAVNRSRGNMADLRKIALLVFGHDQFRIWAHRKAVAIYVFRPWETQATRTQALRWFQLAKVACESFRLYTAVDSGPLRIVSIYDSIPSDGMESVSAPLSGGRMMGEI